MTNFERWQHYTSGLSSPQNYIDWSWFYTISCHLQRRVWCVSGSKSLFPNMYVILVGEPGVGKGLVLSDVSEFTRFWKLKDMIKETYGAKTNEDKAQVALVVETDLDHAQKTTFQGNNKQANHLDADLIPVAADATTYQALVNSVGNAYRRINFWNPNKGPQGGMDVYGHSSLCFILQELGSLMRKQTNDVVNYMLGLYDCPVDYEYESLTRGKDRVRKGCLNMIAGTTPSFMQSTFDDRLTDDGFTSRTFYIYAAKNRRPQFRIPAHTPEQLAHKEHLLQHLRKLTCLYGPCKISDRTWTFLEAWWFDQETNKSKRPNTSLKLKAYYSRKNIHVMKLAMAMHFSEDCENEGGAPKNEIPLETFQRAITFLDKEEKNMHLALNLEGNNPLAKVSKKILELLGTGEKNFVEIFIECNHMANRQGIEESIAFLDMTDQIRQETKKDETLDKNVVYYFLKHTSNNNNGNGVH